VWQNLQFVQEGRIYHLEGIVTPTGGPITAELLAENVAEVVAGGQQSGTRTISHAAGETEIAGVPQRIVALSWPLGADLLTLGVTPVGMGNADTFNEIVNLDEVVLPPEVASVGAPWEPNLEAIAQLEPDLIIGATHDNELIYEDLSNIAPTLLFDVFVQQPGQEGPNELELMEQNFMAIADVVGKRGEGAAIIDDMHAKFDAAAAELEGEGLGDEKFVLAYIQSDATTMWIWIDALNTQLLERAGLENAYKAAYEAEYQYDYDFGGVAWGLEGLEIVDDPDVHFIFRQHATDTGIPDAWEENPVWEGLSFVEAGHVYPHESLYVYAGPRAAEVFAETVVEMLTSD
jgi:iron complex transport system substrate-binding protein